DHADLWDIAEGQQTAGIIVGRHRRKRRRNEAGEGDEGENERAAYDHRYPINVRQGWESLPHPCRLCCFATVSDWRSPTRLPTLTCREQRRVRRNHSGRAPSTASAQDGREQTARVEARAVIGLLM